MLPNYFLNIIQGKLMQNIYYLSNQVILEVFLVILEALLKKVVSLIFWKS